MCAFSRCWSGPSELETLEPIAEHSLRFAGQVGTAGLGSRKSEHYIATTAERRDKVQKSVRSITC